MTNKRADGKTDGRTDDLANYNVSSSPVVDLIEHPVRLSLDRHGRSEGVHLSGCVRLIAARMGVLKNVDPGDTDDFDETAVLRMSMGLAWEDWYSQRVSKQFEDFIYHPGEFERDGIIGSPDGIEPDRKGKGLVLHEFKLTYKSLNNGATNWMWLTQCKGYLAILRKCLDLDPVLCCRADIHVVWVNGNYKLGMQPVLRRYEITFDPAAIEANWRLMLSVKNEARPEVNK